MVRELEVGEIMGLDELLDSSTEEETKTGVNVKADISTASKEATVTSNTEPATAMLSDTKKCPNCGKTGRALDNVWKCEEKWCGVDHFVTEEGYFCLPLDDDDTFLSGYSV